MNPEYGRPYTEARPRPRRALDERGVRAHRAHPLLVRDFLAGYAHRVLFCDTDAFTTAVFHEVYLGTPATGFEDLVAREYDLFVVCGLDVPWRGDGIREFEASGSGCTTPTSSGPGTAAGRGCWSRAAARCGWRRPGRPSNSCSR